MKINVDLINEITGVFESSQIAFVINAHLTPHQIECLFYKIWEEIGNEGISDLLKKECYELKKSKS